MADIWGVITELSDQLSRMRQYASQLHNQSIKVKVCCLIILDVLRAHFSTSKSAAFNSETGFVLRRYDL